MEPQPAAGLGSAGGLALQPAAADELVGFGLSHRGRPHGATRGRGIVRVDRVVETVGRAPAPAPGPPSRGATSMYDRDRLTIYHGGADTVVFMAHGHLPAILASLRDAI